MSEPTRAEQVAERDKMRVWAERYEAIAPGQAGFLYVHFYAVLALFNDLGRLERERNEMRAKTLEEVVAAVEVVAEGYRASMRRCAQPGGLHSPVVSNRAEGVEACLVALRALAARPSDGREKNWLQLKDYVRELSALHRRQNQADAADAAESVLEMMAAFEAGAARPGEGSDDETE